MQILRPRAVPKLEPRPRRIAAVRARPTTSEIVRRFKRAPGYEEIVARIPQAATVKGWDTGTQIAYFSVCGKTGAARYLDLWDADHFDGFTDMAASLRDCRAWFSHVGYATWGSAQTATGHINCYFDATAGDYSCVVNLQSYPGSAGAQVECLIDNSSYGPLPFTGSILQPHFATLTAGGHSFRIRQMSGSFFFLSLTIYRF
jgi:hypothetical protein